ncbi:MAG: cytochrome c-type biogenesis protein CcmH [Thermoleophilia bacterium]
MSVVSDKLVCQCGCAAVLTECPHSDCGWGIPAKKYITEQLESGADPEALVQYYVSEYGEQVLAAPTKRGFNIVAWVTPFVALVIGAVAVYYLIGGWARGRMANAGPVGRPEDSAEVPEELERRLDDELKDFD